MTYDLTSCHSCYEQVILGREYDIDFQNQPSFIIDCGANVGFASLYFHKVFPAARILAIEPDPSNFGMLVANTKGIDNITPIHAAVWHDSTYLQIDNSAGGAWGRRVKPSLNEAISERALVKAVTIAELISQFAFPSVDLLKLDIEGAELELFSADVQWLKKVSVIAIELHDRFRPGCTAAFNEATREFSCRRQVGENLFVARPGALD